VLELKWQELARADLLAIVDYISDDNIDAVQRIKDDIETKTSTQGSGVRSCLLPVPC